MKTLLCFVLFNLVLLSRTLGAVTPEFDAVRDADRDRIAATIAGDIAKLSALLSEELRYAHADGRVQTKHQFLAAASGSTTRYVAVEPRDLEFKPISTGAVTMSGRARVEVLINEQRSEFHLRFLAVWREEAGQWRLFAYQSAPLPPSSAK